MKLAVISHKLCWIKKDSPTGFSTDGGFPIQISSISELFDKTKVVVPCSAEKSPDGLSCISGQNLSVRALSMPLGSGLLRKLYMPIWLLRNGWIIWREIADSDAVHAPIPGDVGTIGMFFALIQRKPLFVRHCGNWLEQRTAAERFWKWSMERFAGGKNVMLATGGSDSIPSKKNPNIKWIFSTSLSKQQVESASGRSLTGCRALKLVTACRLEKRKGVDLAIESLPLIIKKFPETTLDIIGDGSLIGELKAQSARLGVENKVFFHGRLSQPGVIELMKQADVFCFPTSASEGFPKVVLEALSCGLPVLTTKVSVLPKLIGNGCGILLDEATPESISTAIGKMLENPSIYKAMSERAVATAQQYSLESWRDTIAEALKSSWHVQSLSTASPA